MLLILCPTVSYLTIDDGEEFPGKLSCDHGGFMKKLSSGENLISEMSDYFEFLSGWFLSL